MELVTIKTNMSKLIRHENKEGRDYLVAPVVLLVEGVHNNIFYPAEELAKFPAAWNGRPLPLFHPEKNGKPVTANSPKTIEEQSVGQVFYVNFESATDKHPARLVGEAWIDTGKLTQLAEGGNAGAKDLAKLLDEDGEIEISTGLFTDDEIVAGKFKDLQYIAIARNHRPDHLAILPNGKGACSVKDGCGMPRVNAEIVAKTTIDRFRSLFARLVGNQPKANELTHRDLTAALEQALRQKLNLQMGQFINISDMGSDFVVYSFFDDSTRTETLRKRMMTVSSGDQIKLDDADEVVIRRTEYIAQPPQVSKTAPRANTIPPTVPTQSQGKDTMETEKMVDALIANEKSKFTAEDKPVLLKMNAAVLTALAADCQCKEPAAAPIVNAAAAAALTREDVVAIVTESMNKALPVLITNAVNAKTSESAKAPILQRLKANAQCKLGHATLEALSLEALAELEESINPGFFGGRGAVRTNAQGENPHNAPAMPALFTTAKA